MALDLEFGVSMACHGWVGHNGSQSHMVSSSRKQGCRVNKIPRCVNPVLRFPKWDIQHSGDLFCFKQHACNRKILGFALSGLGFVVKYPKQMQNKSQQNSEKIVKKGRRCKHFEP